MTLVVARKGTVLNSDIIFITSDTRLTDPLSGEKVSWKNGVVKTSIINKNLAVSWAGGSTNADDCLKQFNSSRSHDEKNEIIDFFYNFHLNSFKDPNQSVDFIIFIGGANPEIVEIKNKQKTLNCKNTWIGSQKAFNLFQKNASTLQQQYQYLSQYMIKAMENVIETTEYPEVGDFAVGVVYNLKDGFFFQPRFSSINTAQKIHSGINYIEIGDAASGSYTISLNTCYNNRNALAFYFNQGKFGLLYTSDNGGIIRAKDVINGSPDEFSKIILDKYGLEIKVQLSCPQ